MKPKMILFAKWRYTPHFAQSLLLLSFSIPFSLAFSQLNLNSASASVPHLYPPCRWQNPPNASESQPPRLPTLQPTLWPPPIVSNPKPASKHQKHVEFIGTWLGRNDFSTGWKRTLKTVKNSSLTPLRMPRTRGDANAWQRVRNRSSTR